MTSRESNVRLGIGSQTAAQKARAILKEENIQSRIVKIESRVKDGGCLYGLEIDNRKVGEAARILQSKGIHSTTVQ